MQNFITFSFLLILQSNIRKLNHIETMINKQAFSELTVDHDIILRRISYSDSKVIFGLIDKYRDSLRLWLPFVDMTLSPEHTEAFIGSLFALHSREIVFVVSYQDQAAGLIGYKDIDQHNKKLEIGYWIAPVFEGRGIITRSLKTLIETAFEKMDINRIQIKCAVTNTKSSNLPKKLNFRFEGIERAGELLNGHFVDLEIYGLLRDDWRKNQG